MCKGCPSCSVFAAVVASGVAFVAAPYGLVSVLNKLEGTKVCWDEDPCFYQKLFSDGVLPGVPNPLHYQKMPSVPPISNDFYDKLLQSNVAPCVADSHFSIPMALKRRCALLQPINTLGKAASGLFFRLSLVGWGISRVIHDVLALKGSSHSATLWASVLSLISLAATLMGSASWAQGACELFFAKIDEDHDCGCYFRLDVYHAAPAAFVTLTLMLHLRSKCQDICCEALNGPYLFTLKQHVPLGLTQDTATGPTGTLLLSRGLGSGRAGAAVDPSTTTTTTSRSGKPSRRSLQRLALGATACQAFSFWWAFFTVVSTLVVQVGTAGIHGSRAYKDVMPSWLLYCAALPVRFLIRVSTLPWLGTFMVVFILGTFVVLLPRLPFAAVKQGGIGILLAAFPSLPFFFDIWDAEVSEAMVVGRAGPFIMYVQKLSWYTDAKRIIVDDSLAEYDWCSFAGGCCGSADTREDGDGYLKLGGQPEDDGTTGHTVK